MELLLSKLSKRSRVTAPDYTNSIGDKCKEILKSIDTMMKTRIYDLDVKLKHLTYDNKKQKNLKQHSQDINKANEIYVNALYNNNEYILAINNKLKDLEGYNPNEFIYYHDSSYADRAFDQFKLPTGKTKLYAKLGAAPKTKMTRKRRGSRKGSRP
jgi:hypothetical protein